MEREKREGEFQFNSEGVGTPKIEPWIISTIVHFQIREILKEDNRKRFMDNMNA